MNKYELSCSQTTNNLRKPSSIIICLITGIKILIKLAAKLIKRSGIPKIKIKKFPKMDNFYQFVVKKVISNGEYFN